MKTEYESSATKTASMPIGIYALAISGFAMGTEGYVYVGHLNALADEMGTALFVALEERTRVVVTGIGWSLPLGNRIETAWKRLLQGEWGRPADASEIQFQSTLLIDLLKSGRFCVDVNINNRYNSRHRAFALF
jgi:hypothetical protein